MFPDVYLFADVCLFADVYLFADNVEDIVLTTMKICVSKEFFNNSFVKNALIIV